jgi:hypothetical protein
MCATVCTIIREKREEPEDSTYGGAQRKEGERERRKEGKKQQKRKVISPRSWGQAAIH